MNVSSNGMISLAVFASSKSLSRLVTSILFRISTFGVLISASRCMMASASSSMPFRASIRRAITSASRAPPQAVSTMARSRRRLGWKMPGVSTKTSWALSCMAMPRTIARVVWTLWVTMETLVPTSWLIRVDLPAFGAPISAMKPARVSAGIGAAASGRGMSNRGFACGMSSSSEFKSCPVLSRRLHGGARLRRQPVRRSVLTRPGLRRRQSPSH